MTGDALAYIGAAELAARIRNRDISPVEVMDATLTVMLAAETASTAASPASAGRGPGEKRSKEAVRARRGMVRMEGLLGWGFAGFMRGSPLAAGLEDEPARHDDEEIAHGLLDVDQPGSRTR